MKLEVPLKYVEEYLPGPRYRKLREREVEETFSVDIQEVASTEAPVVLRTHDHKRYCDAAVVPTDYRQFQGTLYIPLRTCDMRCVETNDEANQPFSIEELSPYLKVYGLKSRDAAVKEIMESAKRFLLVDGVLWKRTGEPMYKVCTFGLGHNHGGTALMIENHYNSNCRWTDYFTALQQEEAITAAVEIALRRGDDQSLDRIQDKRYYIEVLDPSAVRANPRAWGGKGDDFLNSLDEITSCSDSVLEAGLLAIAFSHSAMQSDRCRKVGLDDQITAAKSQQDQSRISKSEVKSTDHSL